MYENISICVNSVKTIVLTLFDSHITLCNINIKVLFKSDETQSEPNLWIKLISGF